MIARSRESSSEEGSSGVVLMGDHGDGRGPGEKEGSEGGKSERVAERTSGSEISREGAEEDSERKALES